MSEGFPLLTTKKMHWKSIVTELLWFLRGDTNIKYLVDNGCHIWDGDAYKRYSNHFAGNEDIPSKEWFINEIKNNDEFAKKWGELGPIYGRQWRGWRNKISANGEYVPFGNDIDQIANSINLLKIDPDSRRNKVNAWNVGELDQMVLPPCHTDFQFYTRELSERERLDYAMNVLKIYHPIKDGELVGTREEHFTKYNIPTRAISLMWSQRSVDTFLGLPFNIASYGLLLEIIAKEVNMIPDELIGNLGDVHLYSNHKEQAVEQIGREPFDLPTITITENNWYLHEKVKEHLGEKTFFEKIESYNLDCFTLNNYQSHQSIKAPLSN